MTAFEVGQKFLYVPTRAGHPEYVTITKVGRVWVKIGGYMRFRKGDLPKSTECGRGTIWPSETHYRTAREKQKLWDTLHLAARNMYACPKHLDADTIRQIAGLLKIELPQP